MRDEELELKPPDAFAGAFRTLIELTDDEFEKLILALSGPQLTAGSDIAGQLHFVDKDLGNVVDAAVSSIGAAAALDLSPSRFTALLGKEINAEDFPTFSDRFQRLLGQPLLGLRAKILRDLREPGPQLENFRTFTNLRPVFDVKGGAEHIEGFAVSTVVKLEVLGTHGSPREIVFMATEGDLKTIKAAVERDLTKRATLARYLEDSRANDLTSSPIATGLE